MKKVPLSVVILAKNEAHRIAGSLDAVVSWADEVLVIDDESTDATSAIAQQKGARVIRKKMENEGAHRNWAHAQARNEWIFSLDADEVPTAELKEEISRTLPQSEFDAYSIPRKNFIGDYWLQWGGFYPASQIKLLKKSKFRWEEVGVHPRAFMNGPTGRLTQDLLHYTYRDSGDFLRKLNNQTTLEAQKWAEYSHHNPKKAAYKMNVVHALWRMFDRFVRTYFRKRGYRDGFTGFVMACFASLYQLVSYVKYRELKQSELKRNT